jgi:hypothetical protein
VGIEERRRKHRFPLALGLRYSGVAADKAPLSGVGQTTNISSSGLLFRCAEQLEVGSRLALDVNWPASHDDGELRFHIAGRVTRSTEAGVAVAFGYHSFAR